VVDRLVLERFLRRHRHIGLDTSLFIYFVESHPTYQPPPASSSPSGAVRPVTGRTMRARISHRVAACVGPTPFGPALNVSRHVSEQKKKVEPSRTTVYAAWLSSTVMPQTGSVAMAPSSRITHQ
jgi:hypothetical protein